MFCSQIPGTDKGISATLKIHHQFNIILKCSNIFYRWRRIRSSGTQISNIENILTYLTAYQTLMFSSAKNRYKYHFRPSDVQIDKFLSSQGPKHDMTRVNNKKGCSHITTPILSACASWPGRKLKWSAMSTK